MIEKAKESARKFNLEIRKSIGTAVIAAFGLLIALAWKDVITEFVKDILGLSPVQNLLINALVITVISVIAIMLITKIIPPQ